MNSSRVVSEFKELKALVRKDWNYKDDQARATIVSATLFEVAVHELPRPPVKPKIRLLPPRPPTDLIEAWNVIAPPRAELVLDKPLGMCYFNYAN